MNLDIYKAIPFEKRNQCVVCGALLSTSLIELPNFPITEVYVSHMPDRRLGRVDQGFQFCSVCNHGQLENVIDVKFQYSNTDTYNFRTSQSASARETNNYFINFVKEIMGNNPLGTIVDIGCNDMYLLSQLTDYAEQLIGIDPILKGREDEFSHDNIIAIGDFFEAVDFCANSDAVFCKDVLEHVSKPREFVEKIVEEISNDTLVFIQIPLLDTILHDCRFDQVFHQHLNYFTIQSFQFLIQQVGCTLIDFKINYDHWGVGMFVFKKGSSNVAVSVGNNSINNDYILNCYHLFKDEMALTNRRMIHFGSEIMYGYGAALMLPVLSYYLENDFKQLVGILDDDPSKTGKFYLNLPVQIQDPKTIDDISETVILLTAISSKINVKCILKKLFEINPKHILFPLKTI